MIDLRNYLATFIQNSEIVDLAMVILIVVLASAILGAIGLDIFNSRK